MNRTCALTGHRALPEDFDRNALYDALEERVRSGCDRFLCGMAMGFDLLALECLIALKQQYKIRLEACIPYAGQERGYPAAERRRYRELLSWCDEKNVLYPAYFRGCFLARDRYMVDRAEELFAYLTQRTGGAAYTVHYAEEKGVPVFLFGAPAENPPRM